jgi:hypothetical protein
MANQEPAVIDYHHRRGGSSRIEACSTPLLPTDFPQTLLDELVREDLVQTNEHGALSPHVNTTPTQPSRNARSVRGSHSFLRRGRHPE